MLIPPQLIVDALTGRRCLMTARPLEEREHLLSKKAFPGLYSGQAPVNELRFLRHVSEALPQVFRSMPASALEELRRFMQIVLQNGRMHHESFLQRYIFEFWETIWSSDDDEITLSEKYLEGDAADSTSAFSSTLLPRVYEGGKNIPDILALGGQGSRSMYVIELKNVALDDRAVGQILRYYQVARGICDRMPLRVDIRKVVPILIVPSCEINFWHSIPYFFREILELYFWRTDRTGTIRLFDGKQSLRDTARTRIMFSAGA